MCWARSFIPKLVWQIGDSTSNVIEGLHSDVNTEGIACSLVGGIHRGHHFDNLKLKTLDVWFQTLFAPVMN
jgi:streptomycin 6-kinase